jgi:hypothetical protein
LPLKNVRAVVGELSGGCTPPCQFPAVLKLPVLPTQVNCPSAELAIEPTATAAPAANGSTRTRARTPPPTFSFRLIVSLLLKVMYGTLFRASAT